jgi:dipeptidyl aminopeptidase/acylaminoacyl peptidase
MLKEPLLDDNAVWKQRFRLQSAYGMWVAKADPTRGLAGSNISGMTQLYAWNVASGELRQLTNGPVGVRFGVLSPDGRYVYYLEDSKGDEIGHLVRLPYEGGSPEDITPDLPSYAVPFESDVIGLSISYSTNMLGYSTATAEGFSLYCVPLGPNGEIGTARKLYASTKLVVGPVLSYKGEIAVLASTEWGEGLQFTLLAFDTPTGRQIGTLHDEQSSIQPVKFSPLDGDMRVLAMSNRSGYNRPVLWNIHTGERTDIMLDELEGEIEPLDWSSDGQKLLLKQFSQAVPRLFVYDLWNERLVRLQHPVYGYINNAYFMPGDEIYVSCDDSTHDLHLVALDAGTGMEKRVVFELSETPPSHPLTSVHFASSDGQMIQAWLGVPDGEGPFPTILETHGGPDAVATSGFWPSGQVWIDHGFAYITINYRGSTTFGRAFKEQIWGDIGHWELEDMVAAHEWLVQQGIADPEKIFLTGWSNGGYLTLHALSKQPHLWAGGMAGVAVADCAMSYEDEAGTLKAYDATLFKGTPQERPELYRIASPITYAEQVRAPILVIQGRNDTRCTPRQMEVYEAKMKDLGKSIEVHWFDAGHGTSSVEEQIKHQELMLRFVYRVLGRE